MFGHSSAVYSNGYSFDGKPSEMDPELISANELLFSQSMPGNRMNNHGRAANRVQTTQGAGAKKIM